MFQIRNINTIKESIIDNALQKCWVFIKCEVASSLILLKISPELE
jgi:hypothetical protein